MDSFVAAGRAGVGARRAAGARAREGAAGAGDFFARQVHSGQLKRVGHFSIRIGGIYFTPPHTSVEGSDSPLRHRDTEQRASSCVLFRAHR